MGLFKGTARKIAKKPYKPYDTTKGNTYIGIPLYDKWGRFHGTAIYKKNNTEFVEKPKFVFYLTDDRFSVTYN